jgi:cyclic beta-1,2-glucan synthetase
VVGARGSVLDLARIGISPQRAFAMLRAGRNGEGTRGFSLLAAHRAWRTWRLPIDLVVLGDGPPASGEDQGEGGIIPLRGSDLPEGGLDLILASARLVVDGPLLPPAALPEPAPVEASGPNEPAPRGHPEEIVPGGPPLDQETLRFENGWGGFAPESGEYVIRVDPRGSPLVLPPRPWINVVANERFGFLLSETGAGTTWSGNSREHRLTPWSNDPLLDPHGEALYLRDEETGHLWSPWPGPCPGTGPYEVRHGLGFSRCRYRGGGIDQETTVFVPRGDPVRITRIRLTNRSDRSRKVSLTSYSRLDLTHPVGVGPAPVTAFDPETGAVLARNPLSGRYGDRVAFGVPVLPAPEISRSWTGDRRAFLGPEGSPARPGALRGRGRLDGRTGSGLDPCIAYQVELELKPGERFEMGFLLGEGESDVEARDLLARYADGNALQKALEEVTGFWQEGVSRVQVETPSPGLDLLVNGWLPYQVLACRMWGRSALYQSGGAFGFRDQLQDASSLLLHWPELTRSQILLHAGHQFLEGDVLHWWHPPGGEGIRTRFGDDLLWLPYLTAHYVRTTGDRDILDEIIPFLTARPLAPDEDEALLLPGIAEEAGDLYEHGCRALDRSLTTGRHGLPLFGSGDWNDGMNRVGAGGFGESVWLGQFLVRVLGDFLPLCEARGDDPRVRRYRAHREALRAALNDAGWDGEWYRRGFYDNGAPLGSKASVECRIDALAQAWSVLSGTAPPERAVRAMEAVDRYLVSEEDGILRLLVPPFENTPNDPGYIKGYVPGVRENGGQYTHAALWVVCAFAELGRNDRVAPLLEMLSPVTHAATAERAAVYELEPYVVAADVYGVPPHVGRGGWSWYTGSAGWMIRAVLESLLGMKMRGGDTLSFRPCIPDTWPGFTIRYRIPGEKTRYEILVHNPDGIAREVVAATLDGTASPIGKGEASIPLVHDGALHRIEITLGGGAGKDR